MARKRSRLNRKSVESGHASAIAIMLGTTEVRRRSAFPLQSLRPKRPESQKLKTRQLLPVKLSVRHRPMSLLRQTRLKHQSLLNRKPSKRLPRQMPSNLHNPKAPRERRAGMRRFATSPWVRRETVRPAMTLQARPRVLRQPRRLLQQPHLLPRPLARNRR